MFLCSPCPKTHQTRSYLSRNFHQRYFRNFKKLPLLKLQIIMTKIIKIFWQLCWPFFYGQFQISSDTSDWYQTNLRRPCKVKYVIGSFIVTLKTINMLLYFYIFCKHCLYSFYFLFYFWTFVFSSCVIQLWDEVSKASEAFKRHVWRRRGSVSDHNGQLMTNSVLVERYSLHL